MLLFTRANIINNGCRHLIRNATTTNILFNHGYDIGSTVKYSSSSNAIIVAPFESSTIQLNSLSIKCNGSINGNKYINNTKNLHFQNPTHLNLLLSTTKDTSASLSFKRYYSKKEEQEPINNKVIDKEVDFHVEEEGESGTKVDSQGVRIEPKYYIEFTCTYHGPGMDKQCGYKSQKTFSKHSYHKGVVIIRCEGCKKFHLIADHLGWTGYTGGKTIEDWMKDIEPIKKMNLGEIVDKSLNNNNNRNDNKGDNNNDSNNNGGTKSIG